MSGFRACDLQVRVEGFGLAVKGLAAAEQLDRL